MNEKKNSFGGSFFIGRKRAWGQNLSPCVAGGTMGAGHFSQFEFISVAEGKPSQPGWRPWKCTPSAAFGGVSPRRGRFALRFAYSFISSTGAEHRADFPLRVEVPPQAGIGVHFHRAEGPVCLFSPPDRAILRFYQNWRRRRPPQPSEPSEPSRRKPRPS